MALAALYDIHANLPALEAVLEEIHGLAVERIVVGGDVLPGPMPREALAALLHLHRPVQFIRGDGERAVLAEAAGEEQVRVELGALGSTLIKWMFLFWVGTVTTLGGLMFTLLRSLPAGRP